MVVETQGLTRRFGKRTVVDRLALQVLEGSVFAFVGPNGAGKTTTIRMLMNILEPTAGRATVLGRDSRRLRAADFRGIGYVSENQELPDWMTLRQFLAYCAPLYPTWDRSFADALVRQFDLPLDQPLDTLSRGMRMKAALLSSLAYRPRLLVLDEPFAGLDALVRDELIQGVLELTGQEHWTVFIASHDVDEVERLADTIGIINKGHLELTEPVPSLLARFRQVEVTVTDARPLPSDRPPAWLHLEQAGRSVRFVDTAYDEQTTAREVQSRFPDRVEVTTTPMSLRAIFIALAKTYRLTA
jgi:ABC-2 type transport system ATP-binding protein